MPEFLDMSFLLSPVLKLVHNCIQIIKITIDKIIQKIRHVLEESEDEFCFPLCFYKKEAANKKKEGLNS